MDSKELEFIVNGISIVVLFVSFVLLMFLSYRLLKRENRSYIETAFGLALVFATIASLEAAIFRSFYIIFTSGPLIDTWKFAWYLYFILMSISLTFILIVALGILGGRRYFYLGFLSVIAILPISYGTWFIEGAVTTESGMADIRMTFIGVISIFGVLVLQILINTLLYYYIYSKTKNKGSLYMVYGMAIIALSAAVGGFSGLLGYYGRLMDPIGYIGVVIGVYFILTAVEILKHDFSRLLPYFAKLNSQ
ncbi:MAG: hypothetical protein JSW11_19435 [Candidatus Heimdallarchaeota archaeon]|nr:MAG: hypothetical protein JSW11_19435 [Candidatus Heimdallarchaeota archaeon]